MNEKKLTAKQHKLVMQMFVGKVSNIIGFDECLKLIKESKEDLGLTDKNKVK